MGALKHMCKCWVKVIPRYFEKGKCTAVVEMLRCIGTQNMLWWSLSKNTNTGNNKKT